MTRSRSVALLQCDHVDASLRPVAGDYDDMFARLLADHAPDVRLDPVDVVGGEPLPAAGAHDGILITGSRHSATDDLPWIGKLEQLIRDALEVDVPVVGICFGHQVLAQALGGTVERAAVGWGVGVHTAEVTRPRPWMQPPADRFRLLVSHQDQVTGLPSDAVPLATSEHSPLAAFEVGTGLGFQGHPEFVPAYADALLEARRDRIGDDLVEQARTTLDVPTDHGLVARWIDRFLASGAAGR